MSTNKRDLHNPGRRRVLGGLGALSAGSLFPRLWMGDALANPGSGYRALVCIFLYGGNDANNMLIPNATSVTNGNYVDYSTARPVSSGLNLSQSQLAATAITDSSSGSTYYLHPSMGALQSLYTQSNSPLAIQMNMGTLVAPITKAIYQNPSAIDRAKVPVNLYSHTDQENQQAASSILDLSTGWGGRMADQLGTSVGGSAPVGISIAGNALFLKGSRTSQVAVSPYGGLSINGGFGTTAGEAQLQALLGSTGSDSALVATMGGLQSTALNLSTILNPILSGATPSSISSAFAPFSTGNSYFSQQMQAVAKLIATSSLGSVSRQIFFVSMGGFDTHNNQIPIQAPLLQQLSEGMTAFYNATVNLGVASQVTSFTLSDFARTLQPASGQGTDHAWGSHHFVLGGAVHGGKNYGTFPSLALGGPDDTTGQGRWLPTTGIDQYGATLGAWLGLSPTALAAVFPNLANFPIKNIGFV